jgi:hypothetical protein
MYVRIGYFEGFQGQNTILISGDQDGLLQLANELRRLEEIGCPRLEVHRLPFVRAYRGVELAACPVGKERGIRTVERAGKSPRFTWEHSAEGWLEAAEKIVPVAENGGHAYLVCIGPKDAVVMVSSGEYDERIWENKA